MIKKNYIRICPYKSVHRNLEFPCLNAISEKLTTYLLIFSVFDGQILTYSVHGAVNPWVMNLMNKIELKLWF